MSTLRVSNIEAKADPSSPTVNEKVKITNSNGKVMLHLDGATVGVTTIGINTTASTFSVDNNQNVTFVGVVSTTTLRVGIATTSLYIEGQAQLNRVAITTTSSNTQLVTGRTFVYYAPGTYTLPASPTPGDRLEIINRSGIVTAILARNGSNIMGMSEDLTMDILDAAFKVTYSNVTDGWVVST